MKRLVMVAVAAAVALGACASVGRLVKCSVDCAFPDEGDAGVSAQPSCGKPPAK
jgi:hypothetical protein